MIGTACTTETTATDSSTSISASAESDSSTAATSAESPDLATLQAEVTELSEQYEYTDAETGMTVMYLATAHPELFAAELFVSGQWDITRLENLTEETFFYIAAEGDASVSGGQAEVEQMLTESGVSYDAATWNATWSAQESADAAAALSR